LTFDVCLWATQQARQLAFGQGNGSGAEGGLTQWRLRGKIVKSIKVKVLSDSKQ